MKLTVFSFLIVMILMACTGPAWPDEFRLTPSLTVNEKYNDNIFLSTSDRQKDWVTVLSPGISLVDRTERLDLSFKARLDDIHYKDLPDINALDQFYSGQVRFAVTDRLILRSNAGFTRDSQPDRDIESTGLALSTGRRENRNCGAFLDYRLQDITTATVSYKYDEERYYRVGYTDWWSQAAGLGLARDLSKWVPGTKGLLNFDYAYYHFEDNIIDNYGVTMGIKHAFSEKWSLLLNVGGRYTHSTSVVNSEERSSKEWGTVGQLVMAYQDNFTTLNMMVKKDIMPASGRNGATDRILVTFDLRRRFTYELQGFIVGGYYLNKSDQGQYAANEIDELTMRGGAGLRHEFSRDIFLEASYEYTNAQHRSSDTQADRNLFLLKFFVQHSLLE